MRRLCFSLFAFSALAGCSISHTSEDAGVRCGPTVCPTGTLCCNESCGICIAPGGSCTEMECVDGGHAACGATRCGPAEECCADCDGDPFCHAGPCPPLGCPPPPPGCDACGLGERCCPTCPGSPPVCVAGAECPAVDCPPPPACGAECGAGELCCEGCPGSPPFCVEGSSCPDLVCPPPSGCSGREYCDCGGGCEPLIDLSTGCVCPCDDPFNCTGELCACACGGATYLGCADVGRCAETEVHCGVGCNAVLDSSGCPACVCATPG